MKKIIALLITLVCAISCVGMLVGCGCTNNDNKATTAKEETTIEETTEEETTVEETTTEQSTTKKAKKEKKNKKPVATTKNYKEVVPGKISSTLIGKWKYKDGNFSYEFKNDGTGIYKTGSQRMTFYYTDNKKSVRIEYTDGTPPLTLKYKIKGNKLYLNDGSGEAIYIRK